MDRLIDGFWRTVFRFGHPCARVVWQATGRPARGVNVALWHAGRLLCVEQSYRAGLGLPGGGLNRGEASHAAASRELFEEVGIELAPEQLRPAGTLAFMEGRCAIEDAFFEVELSALPEVRIDRREIVWAGFLSLEALCRARLQRPVRLYLERLGQEGRQSATTVIADRPR